MNIDSSIFFDRTWYKHEYSDLVDETNLAEHYLNQGWKFGYIPSLLFDGNLYLKMYPDVRMNPLLHYLTIGRQQGRQYFTCKDRLAEILLKLSFKIKLLPSETALLLCAQHFKKFKKNLNLEYPTTYTEKLCWLIINHNQIEHRWISEISDKYLVRYYIKETLGQDLSVPLIAVYNSPDEIDLAELPDQFVLKISNGCNQNLLVKNKQNLNLDHVKKLLRSWMQYKNNLYFFDATPGTEVYLPKIIIEKYLDNGGSDPVDFRLFCANGKVCGGSCSTNQGFRYDSDDLWAFYNKDYKHIPIALAGCNQLPILFDNPYFERMKNIAEQLSQGFAFLRVDFLVSKSDFYVGELGLYPSGGLLDYEEGSDFCLSDFIDLNCVKLKKRD